MSKIIGNTTATPAPRSDWAQTDVNKVDFILNKPDLKNLALKDIVEKTDLAEDIKASLEKADAAYDIVNRKADAEHEHNDVYYTKVEVDNVLSQKADASDIPTSLSDLTDDELHRTVTDVDKDIWNMKSEVQMITADGAEHLSTLKIHRITQEEYNQALQNGTIDPDAIYLTPDEGIDLSSYVTIEQLDTKANVEHSHDIDNITNLQTSLNQLLVDANTYTDQEIALLMNNSSAAVDSIMELATAMKENEDVVDALEQAIGNKADTNHDHDDKYYTKSEIDNLELITLSDIDAICGATTNAQVVTMSEGVF